MENGRVVKPLCYSFTEKWSDKIHKDKVITLNSDELSLLKVNYSFDNFLNSLHELYKSDANYNKYNIAAIRYKHRTRDDFDRYLAIFNEPMPDLSHEKVFMANRSEEVISGIPTLSNYGIFYTTEEGEDFPVIKYLEELFKCPVYMLYEFSLETTVESLVYQTMTLYHITHFNEDIRVVTYDENKFNKNIVFWYFGNKLVFAYTESLKDF